MSIFKDIFGSSVKEIRERNIAKREAIGRVKKLKKAKEEKLHPADIDKDAKALAEELGVSYADAVEYIKDERKSAARKKKVGEVLGFLGEMGQRAKADTARRYHQGDVTGMARDPFASIKQPKSIRRKPRF